MPNFCSGSEVLLTTQLFSLSNSCFNFSYCTSSKKLIPLRYAETAFINLASLLVKLITEDPSYTLNISKKVETQKYHDRNYVKNTYP